jgi:hypothetical protein
MPTPKSSGKRSSIAAQRAKDRPVKVIRIRNLMKRIVSEGPPDRLASRMRFRPFGYNLVELSRFAVGRLSMEIVWPHRRPL